MEDSPSCCELVTDGFVSGNQLPPGVSTLARLGRRPQWVKVFRALVYKQDTRRREVSRANRRFHQMSRSGHLGPRSGDRETGLPGERSGVREEALSGEEVVTE